ncbi:sensor histidine kinase [Pseudogemmobacter sp. W21_MBD1_M6]|uniref:sensor histidine kinase n=1 Tax=Pseudogemmobacter sp. W21_MBD1_M6 TaxID=3240271 RepID=UPI003F9C4AF5
MDNIEQRLKDFVRGGLGLIWQRQAMFVGASLLIGFFYSAEIALFCYVISLSTELFDYYISKRVLAWDGVNRKKGPVFLNLLTLSSVLSAIAVSLFVVLVAREEGIATHFTPLFFLFAASIFAAMNNHQLLRVLIARLVIYGAAFVYIPAHDLWAEWPSPAPFLWLQFATCVFILYFMVDCSRVFLRLYQTKLGQMEELRQERDRVASAYAVQSQFISIVSHELRTPLTSIKGGLGLIESGFLGEVPPKVARLVEIAHKNSTRLSFLIDDLLDLQKYEAGQAEFVRVPMDMAELVRDSVEANESYCNSLGVKIHAKGLDEPLFVNGDYGRLLQVLANVISNAAKFSYQGGEIEIVLERVQDKARIAVRDNGRGIPENSERLVFGKFTQVDASLQREIGGTGLGMSITQHILDGHDGSIAYESEVGKGTTFFITLDAIESGKKVVPDAPPTARIALAC